MQQADSESRSLHGSVAGPVNIFGWSAEPPLSRQYGTRSQVEQAVLTLNVEPGLPADEQLLASAGSAVLPHQAAQQQLFQGREHRHAA